MLRYQYFPLGKPAVNTGMSRSEMMANILLTSTPAGEQVTFAFFSLDEAAALQRLLQDNEVKFTRG